MKNKTTVAVSIVSVIIGLLFGYVLGDSASLSMDTHSNESIDTHSHEEDGHSHEPEDSEMHNMMDMMMANLEGKTGEEIEKVFLEDMIVHHEGAVEMTRALLDQTNRPELTQFGQDIISVQSKEIEMMEAWLQEWYGTNDDE